MRKTWMCLAVLLALSVRVALAGPGAGPGAPNPADPLGLVGTWIEYWPGVNVHDINVITFQNGTYAIQAGPPQGAPYRIDNIRVDGTILRFIQYAGPNAIQYAVQARDANTCAVATAGGPGGGNNAIVWQRQGGQTPVVPAPAPNLPPNVVLGPNGRALPAPGYEWVDANNPDDLRVRPIQQVVPPGPGPVPAGNPPPNVVRNPDGTYRPAPGYEWVDPNNVNDVRVRPIQAPGPGPVPPGPGPVPPGPGPVPPGPVQTDPLGLAGTWIEYWPGVNDHDINVITFQNGAYIVQAGPPQGAPYRIDNIRVEGNVLRFTQYAGPNAIQYAVQIRDPNTCAVATAGGPGGGNNAIVWRRQGGQAPLPVGPTPAPGGNIPPNLIRNPDGSFHPAPGYEWVDPNNPDDLSVRPIQQPFPQPGPAPLVPGPGPVPPR